jgi:hypothetical protein
MTESFISIIVALAPGDDRGQQVMPEHEGNRAAAQTVERFMACRS